LVFLFASNSCTGTEIAESGSAGNIQFSAQEAANGTQVPRSITASGVIPMTCFVGCTSDSLTFNMTLTAAGPALQVMDNSQTTYPVTPAVIVKSHSDFNLVVATGSLTVSHPESGVASYFTLQQRYGRRKEPPSDHYALAGTSVSPRRSLE
jgi:hypothetical protein